jgi:hypothetical protein
MDGDTRRNGENRMTRRGIARRTLAAAASIALLAIPTGAAFAEEDIEEEQQQEQEQDETRIIRQREILMASDGETTASNGWLGSNIHLHSKAGLAFTRQLKLGEQPIVFGLKGPVLKKQKALGLTLLIRF